MRPAFRCGPLIADSDLLEALTRPALISAIVRHAYSMPVQGEAVRSYYEHGPIRFIIETNIDRSQTTLRLR